MPLDSVRPRGPMGLLAAILGVVLILIGLVPAVGGGWPLALHGSPALPAGGPRFDRLRACWWCAGSPGCGSTPPFPEAATLVWALWEVGLNVAGSPWSRAWSGQLVLLWLTLACASPACVDPPERRPRRKPGHGAARSSWPLAGVAGGWGWS
ncbi:hypothetical protein ACRAWD_14065 [Caulobacter segnis]